MIAVSGEPMSHVIPPRLPSADSSAAPAGSRPLPSPRFRLVGSPGTVVVRRTEVMPALVMSTFLGGSPRRCTVRGGAVRFQPSSARSVAYSHKEDAVPAARRTKLHVERIEEHGSALTLFVATVEEVTADGRIEPHEDRLLDRVSMVVLGTYRPLPAEASVIDNGLSLISTLADTCSVTAWAERRAREAADDERRLIDDGLLEPIAA